MALRDQPYLPLYIQDFLTDEKLNECSAATTGVYVKLMCLMHKSDDYGKLLLKQKYKTSESKEENFASMLVRSLPFTFDEIYASVIELISEKVLFVDGDFLCQKRMIKDNNLSVVRGNAGHKGGRGNIGKKMVGSGFIYLMSNQSEHKIGLSIFPERRLFELRSKHKMPDLEIIDTFEVQDMIEAEKVVKHLFKDCIKDEWLLCEFEYALKEFAAIKRKLHTPTKAKIKAKPKPNVENEYDNDIETVVKYLNEKASTDYKPETKTTREIIIARFKEKYTVENFKTVIEKKTKEWIKDEKMVVYLRPSTLFGSKFEGYLNQIEATIQNSNSNNKPTGNVHQTTIPAAKSGFRTVQSGK